MIEFDEEVVEVEEMPSAFSDANSEGVYGELPDYGPPDELPDGPTEDTENVPRETSEEETPENKEDITPPVIDEWKPPEYLPDDLKPKEFKDTKEELEWFKTNYRKAIDYHGQQEFIEQWTKKYEKFLVEKEEKHEELKAIAEMMDGNPELALKLYQPKLLSQLGANSKLTDSEINGLVEEQLSKEFGTDFKSKYDVTEAINEGTLSKKMWDRHQELRGSFEKINEDLEKELQQVKIPTAEDRQKYLDEQYKDGFETFTREEFDEIVKESDEYVKSKKLGYADVHFVTHREAYLKDAYEKGVADGRKGLTRDIERAGGEKIDQSPEKQQVVKLNGREVYDERHPWGTGTKLRNPFIS